MNTQNQTLNSEKSLADLIFICFLVVIPPLGVFLEEGLKKHFWINLLLTILGYFPGLVHGIYITFRRG